MHSDEYELDREANESTSFLQSHDTLTTDEPPSRDENALEKKKTNNSFIIYTTFFGVAIAGIDESLVISTYSTIASQFHELSIGSWLVVAYNFGYCLSLPVCGSLCDSYGRKNVLVVSYFLFMLSCLACGASTSLVQLVIARVFTGLSGAGMVSLVSIIIMDIVPAREVAIYRGYENVVNSIARSMGAPIGGILLDTIGWRWSFIGQVPFILFCTIAAAYCLPASPTNENEKSQLSRLRDIDFAGIISFAVAIFSLISLLQVIGTEGDSLAVGAWTLALAFILSSGLFIAIEVFWARNPLIPMHLLVQKLGIYCLLQILIFTGRSGMITNVAPYFVRVMDSGDFLASATYAMIAFGTSLGSIMSGFIIKYTRRYKKMSIIAITFLVIAYFLIFLTWRNGCTWQSIILLQVGFAQGFLFSGVFIGMSQSSPKEFSSISIVTYFLGQQLGIIIGPSCSLALVQWIFRGNLSKNFGDIPHKNQIINDVLNDSRFSKTLPQTLQKIVRSNYLASFQYVPLLGMVLNLVVLPVLAALREEEVA